MWLPGDLDRGSGSAASCWISASSPKRSLRPMRGAYVARARVCVWWRLHINNSKIGTRHRSLSRYGSIDFLLVCPVRHQMHNTNSLSLQPTPAAQVDTNPTHYTPITPLPNSHSKSKPLIQAVCSILAMTRARILSARLKSLRSAASLSAWYLDLVGCCWVRVVGCVLSVCVCYGVER